MNIPPGNFVEFEDFSDRTIVRFVQPKILDEQSTQILGEQLFRLVDELGRKQLVVNFGNVHYLSSAALGKFITLNKKLGAVGGRLTLCNLDRQIYEVFEITKLNKLFNIERDEPAFDVEGVKRDEPDENLGGVKSRLIPPKPSSGFSAALRPPGTNGRHID